MVVEASPRPAQAQAPAISANSLARVVSVSMMKSGPPAAAVADVVNSLKAVRM